MTEINFKKHQVHREIGLSVKNILGLGKIQTTTEKEKIKLSHLNKVYSICASGKLLGWY